jgi:SAM-dependent methyltransferase
MDGPSHDPHAETSRAFDGVAAIYDGPFGNNSVVQWMRAHLWRAVDRALAPGSRLLDLGCGTGLDAAHFAARGHTVLAIDSSPEMVRRTVARAEQLGLSGRIAAREVGIHELERLTGERFDGIYSDLGPLNCVPDLAPVADACATFLPVGAPLIASVMGRFCPWETAYYCARLHPRRAFLRLSRGAVPVGLNGRTVWTSYYSPGEIASAFSRGFELESCRALGLFLPPPYLVATAQRLPCFVLPLAWLDDTLGGLPLLRSVGDHFLIVLRKAHT